MKNIFYGMVALAIMSLNSCGPTHVIVESSAPAPAPPPPPPPAPAPEVSYQSFYDDLSPYGQWIDNPEYGYVWMPNVGPDFKPYATNGHWVYTDEGWTWASNYSWGWATFHYGRWFYEDGYGWMWIPGNEWAPAWVSWRNSPDYYGWAPLGPSVSISVSAGGGYNPPAHYWCFVPHQYVASPQVNNYYVNESRNVTIINNTTVIRNTTIVNNTVNNTTIINNSVNNRVTVNNYAGGPDPQEVSRVTGSPLRPVALRESNAPGEQMNGGSLAIYRPRVNPAVQPANGGSQTRMIAPSRVQTLNNVRPVNTAIYNNNRGTINNTNVTNNTTNNTNINNNTSNNNTNINNSRNTNINNTTNNNTTNNSSNINNNRNNTTNNTNINNTTNNNAPNNSFNNNRPVVNPSNGAQPAGQPVNQRPVQPASQQAAVQPGQSVQQPAVQPRYQRPVNQPAGQPTYQQPAQTGNQRPTQTYNPNNQAAVRPVFSRPGSVQPAANQQGQQKPATTPAAPVKKLPAHPVTPPKDVSKDTDKKDTRQQ